MKLAEKSSNMNIEKTKILEELNSILDKEDPLLFLKLVLSSFENVNSLKQAQKKLKITDHEFYKSISLEACSEFMVLVKILQVVGLKIVFRDKLEK